MAHKIKHFMDEADIGSGEKTPAELEDMERTSHLREDLENRDQHGKPQDGSQLQEVVEEQQFVNEHENRTPLPLLDEIRTENRGTA